LSNANCCTAVLQVRDAKTNLANFETQDMGKPIDEAEWDMVRLYSTAGTFGLEKHVHDYCPCHCYQVAWLWHMSCDVYMQLL